MSRRTYFDPGPAPANYVPGLGRGASGFTTRSDIGVAIAGRGGAGQGDEGDLFGGEYTAEDREADDIFAAVDERMQERRKDKREQRETQERQKLRKLNPKLQTEFSDLTRGLADVSADAWAAIPDIGDRSIKKSEAIERYTPVPDSMLAAAHATEQRNASVDLTTVAKVQKLQLDSALEKESRSVVGPSSVNAQGYMTAMAQNTTSLDMMDVERARDLLTSVRTTNPTHAPGWIAAARLEEVGGKVSKARKIILEGCQTCPKSDDVWLEAARLHSPAEAKRLFAQAVTHIPRSVKLWLAAAELEVDVEGKQRILRKALEIIPTSVPLWKAAVELENRENARILLHKATECNPTSVELWLALAHLEDHKGARAVLSRARKAIPTDVSIWITAARLEEAYGADEAVETIVSRAVRSLAQHNVIISREKWLEKAADAEKSDSPKTCAAIVHQTVGQGVEGIDRKRTWLEDADNAMREGCFHLARSIYAHALTVFPQKKGIWLRAAQLEKKHGTSEALDELLREAVRNCPTAEVLWLMAAKEKWITGSPDVARRILHEAFAANPASEQIWLAAAKLERETGRLEQAAKVLQKAREQSPTVSVWLKSIKLERLMGRVEEERTLIQKALADFPREEKVWILAASFEERTQSGKAREMYARGVKNCPKSVQLWLNYASLEEQSGPTGRVRATLEAARAQNPQSDRLWLRAVRVETRAGNGSVADATLAKALQECPNSELLWAEAIRMAPKAKRRIVCVDALKVCDQSARVVLAVALVFWADRRLDKAKTWLERAIGNDPLYGDAWAHLYAFEVAFGQPPAQEAVLQRVDAAKPTRGELWRPVFKLNKSEEPRQICKTVARGIDL